MPKQKVTIVAMLLALAAVAVLMRAGDTQRAAANATSLEFSPGVISLGASGDFVDVDVVVTDIGIGNADTAHVNILHGAGFTITDLTCGALYDTAVPGDFKTSLPPAPNPDGDGTMFTCTQQNGPAATTGVVATFRITKTDDVIGQTVLDFASSGAFRTTFYEAGTEVLPGTLGTLEVWDLLADLPDDSVDEMGTLNIPLTTTADGDLPVLSVLVDGGAAPSFIVLTDNGDRTGNLAINPLGDDADVYTVEVTATTAAATDTKTFILTVNNVNQPPVLTLIGDQSVAEDGSLNVSLSASDPDGDGVSFSATIGGIAIPTGFATITDNGNGTGSLDLTPGFDDAGPYTVVVTVTDDGTDAPANETDDETFTLTVDNTNRDPVVAPIADQNVTEGQVLEVDFTVTDPDLDSVTFSATFDGAPIPTEFATITPTGVGTGTLTFTPLIVDNRVGTYAIVVTGDDGLGGIGTTGFQLTVHNVGSVTAPAGTVSLQGVTGSTEFGIIAPVVELVLVSDGSVVDSTAVATDGSFSFTGITGDVYRLEVSAPGYLKHVLGGIDLTVADFDLGVAGETVIVLGGDADDDGSVGPSDLSALIDAFGASTPGDRTNGGATVVDINADGFVSGADLSILISNYNGPPGDLPWD